jgi:hypothetical protein
MKKLASLVALAMVMRVLAWVLVWKLEQAENRPWWQFQVPLLALVEALILSILLAQAAAWKRGPFVRRLLTLAAIGAVLGGSVRSIGAYLAGTPTAAIPYDGVIEGIIWCAIAAIVGAVPLVSTTTPTGVDGTVAEATDLAPRAQA